LNRGPLQDGELVAVFERLIEVMRRLQMKDELGARS
jgi:hypothetical protein